MFLTDSAGQHVVRALGAPADSATSSPVLQVWLPVFKVCPDTVECNLGSERCEKGCVPKSREKPAGAPRFPWEPRHRAALVLSPHPGQAVGVSVPGCGPC